MRVEPSQLVPGCVLMKDVIGKTNRPIIYKNTVLTEEQILILKKFLIPNVEVSHKLENGEIFKPLPVQKDHKEPKKVKTKTKEDKQIPFKKHYLEVVQKYKRLFHNWKNNAPINMPYVRELVVPLFEQIDKIGIEILKLHHYSTKNDYFYHHSIAVGILSTFLAKKLGYNHGESIQVGLAGFLSDCGMAKIDAEIINKFHSLTYREMDEMKEHPKYSYRFVESIPTISKEVKLAIIQHHERLDGSGYPFQLKGKKIHKICSYHCC